MFEQGRALDKGLGETWQEMGFMTICMLWDADGTRLMSTDNKGALIADHLVTSDINVSEEKGCKVTWSGFDLTSFPAIHIKLRATFDYRVSSILENLIKN